MHLEALLRWLWRVAVVVAEAAQRAKSVTTKVSIGLLNCTLFNYSPNDMLLDSPQHQILSQEGIQICDDLDFSFLLWIWLEMGSTAWRRRKSLHVVVTIKELNLALETRKLRKDSVEVVQVSLLLLCLSQRAPHGNCYLQSQSKIILLFYCFNFKNVSYIFYYCRL